MVVSRHTARFVILGFLSLVLVLAGSSSPGPVVAERAGYEETSTSVPYQGRLTSADGRPVADGAYDFQLALYSSEAGGEALWTETQSGVPVRDGYFGLLLGEATPLGLEIVAQERFLAVSVRGPGETEFTALEPRQKLVGPQASSQEPNCATAADHDHCGQAWQNCTGLAIYGEKDGSSMLFVENTGTSDGTKAVWGYANGTSGENYGLAGWTNSATSGAAGVYGKTFSGPTSGVYGRTVSISDWARGVYGYASGSSGLTIGVYGRSDSSSGEAKGVYGYASAASGKTRGVAGQTESNTDFATGVWGEALAASGQTYGLYGRNSSDGGRGVYGYAAASSGGRIGVGGSVNGSGNGLYTPDSLYVGGGCTGCTVVFIAQNAGAETLRVGDVVAVSGVGPVLQGHTAPVLKARRATASDPSVLGVVYMRGEFYAVAGDDPEDFGDSVQPVEGDVAPGDYMLVVTSGLAQVRVAAGVNGLAPGQSLTVAGVAGAATLAGADTAPDLVFARAMEAQADDDGLLWAMIATR